MECIVCTIVLQRIDLICRVPNKKVLRHDHHWACGRHCNVKDDVVLLAEGLDRGACSTYILAMAFKKIAVILKIDAFG